jgi:hypothetical protein
VLYVGLSAQPQDEMALHNLKETLCKNGEATNQRLVFCDFMGHPAVLIESILVKLRIDYPENCYCFKVEQAIPGTRMYPDIQVVDMSGKLCCAVEIGYTRPEKLTAYRQKLQIPDVRWYDKSGNLHADVQERVTRVVIESFPRTTFVAYEVHDWVQCCSEDCETEAVAEWNTEVLEIEGPLTDADEDFLNVMTTEFLADETVLYVITDYIRIWFCLFCDKCGNADLVSEDYGVEVWAIAEDLRVCSPRDFASAWGRRSWTGEWNFAKDYLKGFRIELAYNDGDYLNPAGKRDLDHALTSIRARVIQ